MEDETQEKRNKAAEKESGASKNIRTELARIVFEDTSDDEDGDENVSDESKVEIVAEEDDSHPDEQTEGPPSLLQETEVIFDEGSVDAFDEKPEKITAIKTEEKTVFEEAEEETRETSEDDMHEGNFAEELQEETVGAQEETTGIPEETKGIIMTDGADEQIGGEEFIVGNKEETLSNKRRTEENVTSE